MDLVGQLSAAGGRSDDEYTALTAAAESFRPVGGLAALTGIARAQLNVG